MPLTMLNVVHNFNKKTQKIRYVESTTYERFSMASKRFIKSWQNQPTVLLKWKMALSKLYRYEVS